MSCVRMKIIFHIITCVSVWRGTIDFFVMATLLEQFQETGIKTDRQAYIDMSVLYECLNACSHQ